MVQIPSTESGCSPRDPVVARDHRGHASGDSALSCPVGLGRRKAVFYHRTRNAVSQDSAEPNQWGHFVTINPLSQRFEKILSAIGIKCPGIGFYTFRHVVETIGGECCDQPLQLFLPRLRLRQTSEIFTSRRSSTTIWQWKFRSRSCRRQRQKRRRVNCAGKLQPLSCFTVVLSARGDKTAAAELTQVHQGVLTLTTELTELPSPADIDLAQN